MVEGTHLGSDEPIREYIGLFGEFTLLKDFRCRPSATFSTGLGPIESRFPGGCKLGKPDVGEASVALRVHKNILLNQFYENLTERSALGRETYLLQIPMYHPT
jgi:hypothetical protein